MLLTAGAWNLISIAYLMKLFYKIKILIIITMKKNNNNSLHNKLKKSSLLFL